MVKSLKKRPTTIKSTPNAPSTLGERFNIIAALRRVALRKKFPQTVTTALPDSIVQPRVVEKIITNAGLPAFPASTASLGETLPVLTNVAIPRPPKNPSDSQSDDDDDDDDDDEASIAPGQADGVKNKKSKTKKKTATANSKWVSKLLNQPEKHRDRVYKKKKPHPRQDEKEDYTKTPRPPALFSVTSLIHIELIGKILLFLEIQQPGACCARINRLFASAVRTFYELYCPHPRPQRFLIQKLFHKHQSQVLHHILGLLTVHERVCASECCKSFYSVSNSLPLQIKGTDEGSRFVNCMTPTRIAERYHDTTVIRLTNMNAGVAIRILQLMTADNDEDNESFPMVTELFLSCIRGFSAAPMLFVQLIQVLFTDRVARNLTTLMIKDMELKDEQYKHLSKLLYDGHFPVLQHFNLSQNAFSSRFMRDWSVSLVSERFLGLESLNISDVRMSHEDMERFISCLRHLPNLQQFDISKNNIAIENLALLGQEIANGRLSQLIHLNCYGITSDTAAMGIFIEAFQNNQSSKLQSINLSGNPLTNTKSSQQFADIFTRQCWTQLTSLNMSALHLGEEGCARVAKAFVQCKPTNIQELDISGNQIGRAVNLFARCLENKVFVQLRSLILANNNLDALAFATLGHTFSSGCCEKLQLLDLSANTAGGEGIIRFCPFLMSAPAQRLYVLDLSENEIPHRELVSIAEVLSFGNCVQLQELNLARNITLRSVVKFQELIRSSACPSLISLQIAYAQTYEEGKAFVKDVLSHISVEELRHRKQQQCERRLEAIQEMNNVKADHIHQRCQRQCQFLRKQYDLMENEADRALRRRKLIRKSAHLMIHQEIRRLKQEKYHQSLCQTLEERSN